MSEAKLLNLAEAARFLGMDQRRVYCAARDGWLKAGREGFGGTWSFEPADLESFKAQWQEGAFGMPLAAAARRLGLHQVEVIKEVEAGRLHARRLGNLWLYEEAELDRFAAIRERQP